MLEKSNNIDGILESLNEIRRATASPFLYKRIQARLNQPKLSQSKLSFFEIFGFLISRPTATILFLVLILFIDGIVSQSTFTNPQVISENIPGEELIIDDFDEAYYYGAAESEYAYLFVQK